MRDLLIEICANLWFIFQVLAALKGNQIGQPAPNQPPLAQNQGYIRPPEYVQAPVQIQYAQPPAVQSGYDIAKQTALAEQYKKTAEQYYSEFNQNSQIMTDSLKKIENIVVDVLTDQVRNKFS